MNFDAAEYYKHSNCMDAFIYVQSVIQDTGHDAVLVVAWLTQGTESYWLTPQFSDTIHVSESEYNKWKPYEPAGSLR